MEYEWDEAKNCANQKKHKRTFDEAADFDWATSVSFDRSRHADSERRYAAVGWLDGKLITIVYTWRNNVIRIISLRRANKTEERLYEENT